MLTIVYDSNVLYPSTLRDVLIRLGRKGLVQPKWTERILDETFGNLVKNRPDIDKSRLSRTRELMSAAFLDVVVDEYELWIDQIVLPDENDRHVVAAAIQSEAKVIVTKNLKDFPEDELGKWDIVVKHPDAFLTEMFVRHPTAVAEIIDEIATTWKSLDTTRDDVLASLKIETPKASKCIDEYFRFDPPLSL
ncbi:MAG: PIN domain-containing protein [Coriobacteriales bacterium]|jgi:predicted nucleic acid-binding protein|nr:PIN domain-containing protein [Coriobacteriales bacterium]